MYAQLLLESAILTKLIIQQPQKFMNQVLLFTYLLFNVIYDIKVSDLSK